MNKTDSVAVLRELLDDLIGIVHRPPSGAGPTCPVDFERDGRDLFAIKARIETARAALEAQASAPGGEVTLKRGCFAKGFVLGTHTRGYQDGHLRTSDDIPGTNSLPAPGRYAFIYVDDVDEHAALAARTGKGEADGR